MGIKQFKGDDDEPRAVNFAAERAAAASVAGGGGFGVGWKPEKVIMPHTAGRAGVPTIDDDLDADPHGAPQAYPAWNREDTFVVTRTREQYATLGSFVKAIQEQFGPIFETMMAGQKWCARVYKPTKRPK